jgi:hypothetical protein
MSPRRRQEHAGVDVRLLQEAGAAQDEAEVLVACDRLAALHSTLAEQEHEQLCEQLADLIREQAFDAEADVWRGVAEAYAEIRKRRRAGGPGWTPGERQ